MKGLLPIIRRARRPLIDPDYRVAPAPVPALRLSPARRLKRKRRSSRTVHRRFMHPLRNKIGQFIRKSPMPVARTGTKFGEAILVRRHSVTRRRRVVVRASAAAYG